MHNEDFFDYKGVIEVKEKLELKFAEFAELLKLANDYINKNINVGAESAIYGVLGADILDTWYNNASTFDEFYENFDAWSQLMVSVANSYASFQNDTVKNVFESKQTNGYKLTDVQKDRINAALRNGNSFVNEGATQIIENKDGSKTVSYSNGVVTTYNYKDNGEIGSMFIKNVDGTIDKRYLNPYGSSRINTYDKNENLLYSIDYNNDGNMLLRKDYGTNGKVVSSTAYNEDGTIKNYIKF